MKVELALAIGTDPGEVRMTDLNLTPLNRVSAFRDLPDPRRDRVP